MGESYGVAAGVQHDIIRLLFSSLEYTQIMTSIPFPIIYLPLLLTIGYCYLGSRKTAKTH